MRTAAAVASEVAGKISLLVLALSLLERECCSRVTRCIVVVPDVAAARAAVVAVVAVATAAGVAAAGGVGGPQEAIRQSRWSSRIL